ncbi:hypothetical protein [Candidatus Entotheonella palauensis]|uniref:HepT-like domain-containing protein n=1 Tax=Candidatus Entotheonella gemina TaxID=1429439 RepID=W4M4S8_9BACT|nr:hypothetical protein [Candidatus Entotheonella palauensis]ETX04936.1 MAG: hypothetical protein ETSY2_25945 [Candidatus Entotheonella gemina]
MIERYLVVAGRIRQEVVALERLVTRSERAITAMRQRSEDEDLYLDAAALNLHDFYAGLERIFHHIATAIDRSLPSGSEWHRDLLRQMQVVLSQVRPQVLSDETVRILDEFLRFRHVVRHIYTFEFEAERIEHLVQRLRPCFERVQDELLAFADFLDQLAQDD